MVIPVIKRDDQLLSLPYAPWGSFVSDRSATQKDFKELVNQIHSFAKDQHIKSLLIKHPPSFYGHSVPLSWMKHASQDVQTEINQHIDLTQPVNYHEMERRKLRKASSYLHLREIKNASASYDLLSKWRREGNIPLNIESNHLEALMTNLPQYYTCWGAFHDEKPMAVCVCVKVTDDTMYYFLPATSPKHRQHSPMVFLIDQLIKKYTEEGFRYFDLGQSSVDSIKQEGLFQFKVRMGAQSTEKPVFSMTF